MRPTGILARVLYAILLGIITFLVVFFIGVVVDKAFDHDFGYRIEQISTIVGLLVAGIVFLTRTNPSI